MRRIGYVPQLDGLRALAVLAVLFFHGAVDEASGGFLGVDLFFVVSGYLITALLLEEVDRGGSVAIGAFYGRRVRRLLPAVAVVVAAVAVFAVVYSSVTQAEVIRRDSLGALTYTLNWVQIASDASYFSEFGAPSPLRHLWSLAIEEQWYLLWPVVVAIIARVSACPRRAVGIVSVAIVVASALTMIVLHQRGATTDRLYYGTDTRAQTIAIGSWVATLAPWRSEGPWRRAGPAFAWVALAAAAVMVVFVDGNDAWLYRGGFTLFAVVSAVLVAGLAVPGPLVDVLVSAPLVAVGRISYSLYLWHWPIFVGLTPTNTGLDGPALLLVRFALSFALAVASYALVEQPIRSRAARPGLILATLGVSVVLAGTIARGIQPEEPTVATPAAGAPLVAGNAIVAPAERDGDAATPSAPASSAPSSAPEGARERVLVVGDSIAFSFSLFVVPENVDQYNGGMVGCGLVTSDDLVPRVFEAAEECRDRFALWDRLIDEVDADQILLMTGGWEVFDRTVAGATAPVGSDPWRNAITTGFDELHASARRRDIPLKVATVPCFDAPATGLPGDVSGIRNDPARVAAVNELFAELVASHDGSELVDVAGVVCPQGRPVGELDGVSLRTDGVHYSAEGAAEVWERITL